MKKFLVILTALAFGVCFSTASFAAIGGSAHDFSAGGGQVGGAGGEICIVCHTPHNAWSTNGPLWNHEESTVTTYGIYTTTGTLDATDVGQPDGVSKLCLGCHDGTVGLDNFGDTTGEVNYITGNALLGTDLSNDHPISFTYNTDLANTDGELSDPATVSSTLGGTISADLLFGASNDQMECASCHDVHNKDGNATLLRVDNAGSAFCNLCHNK